MRTVIERPMLCPFSTELVTLNTNTDAAMIASITRDDAVTSISHVRSQTHYIYHICCYDRYTQSTLPLLIQITP